MDITESYLKEICFKFDIDGEIISITPFGDGHIHHTFLLETNKNKYILQNIRVESLGVDIDKMMSNIYLVSSFLKNKLVSLNLPFDREILQIIATKDHKPYLIYNNLYFRMYLYIPNSVSFSIGDNSLIYKSAYAFGRFIYLLNDFNSFELEETFKDFHNTPKRVEKLKQALLNGNKERINKANEEIKFALENEFLSYLLVDKINDNILPLRVTHNDTKLNNVVFDKDDLSPLAVIDLDTVMLGVVAYDFGDGARYACSSSIEEEEDLNKVYFDLARYEAYIKGFLKGTNNCLNKEEISSLPLGIIVITYELAVRFLLDYIENDVYFKTKKEDSNLYRCKNQFHLLKDILNKFEYLDPNKYL